MRLYRSLRVYQGSGSGYEQEFRQVVQDVINKDARTQPRTTCMAAGSAEHQTRTSEERHENQIPEVELQLLQVESDGIPTW